MRNQPDLFPRPERRRAKARKLMHVCDAGIACSGADYERESMVRFRCRCGFESEWMQMRSSEARRGIPCPECNKVDNPVMAGLDRTTGGWIGQP